MNQSSLGDMRIRPVYLFYMLGLGMGSMFSMTGMMGGGGTSGTQQGSGQSQPSGGSSQSGSGTSSGSSTFDPNVASGTSSGSAGKWFLQHIIFNLK